MGYAVIGFGRIECTEFTKEDLGKIIGKHGRTAQSIRTILSASSAKNRKRAVLEIIE